MEEWGWYIMVAEMLLETVDLPGGVELTFSTSSEASKLSERSFKGRGSSKVE